MWQQSELAEMLNEESGDLDTEKVEAAVAKLVEAKPHYRRVGSTPRPDPSQGARSGGVSEPRAGDIFRKG